MRYQEQQREESQVLLTLSMRIHSIVVVAVDTLMHEEERNEDVVVHDGDDADEEEHTVVDNRNDDDDEGDVTCTLRVRDDWHKQLPMELSMLVVVALDTLY